MGFQDLVESGARLHRTRYRIERTRQLDTGVAAIPTTVEDVAVRLGRPIDAEERARVEAFIDDASALVQDYCGGRYDEDAPGIRAVICSEVIRWLAMQPGVLSERTGDVEVTYGAAASAQALSPASRAALKRYRPKLGSISLTRWGP
ncbi:hypothetical protein GCM10010218_19720 [Streptomyces mashuensis]|uniref:Head-to-tail adaptor n=1 Tax=Streptomyces mashuensis TaxID=33904 RepID=A0A919ECE6_9ACTN|nr:hypothetical protein [Streptomyces mashuensis]GHF38602.1 hypothetical protein GCM10010218_19720 [Streptomyces mashuensis]